MPAFGIGPFEFSVEKPVLRNVERNRFHSHYRRTVKIVKCSTGDFSLLFFIGESCYQAVNPRVNGVCRIIEERVEVFFDAFVELGRVLARCGKDSDDQDENQRYYP